MFALSPDMASGKLQIGLLMFFCFCFLNNERQLNPLWMKHILRVAEWLNKAMVDPHVAPAYAIEACTCFTHQEEKKKVT